MDTRKLILHIDGDSGVQSRIELEDFGTTHYIDGDTDMVADLVRRWNAYPELVAKLEQLELRATQARLASNIGQPRLKDADFLRGECERIAKDARAAIKNATNP